ncbi:hypothetical protein DFH29DRAFT_104360 [Suillus ampliporus]|nr:hypothetical protein DFH29DRAFT_104360 [Suillus ampliporus]
MKPRPDSRATWTVAAGLPNSDMFMSTAKAMHVHTFSNNSCPTALTRTQTHPRAVPTISTPVSCSPRKLFNACLHLTSSESGVAVLGYDHDLSNPEVSICKALPVRPNVIITLHSYRAHIRFTRNLVPVFRAKCTVLSKILAHIIITVVLIKTLVKPEAIVTAYIHDVGNVSKRSLPLPIPCPHTNTLHLVLFWSHCSTHRQGNWVWSAQHIILLFVC